jgi:hypothetical protein
VPELTVVLDACLSGEALLAAAKDWFRPAMNTGRRIELVSSSDLRVSYALQFSQALSQLVRQGDVRLDPVLRTAALRGAVGARLTRQVPQSASFDGGGAGPADPNGPWLAHNVAYDMELSPLAWSPDHDVLLPALRHFQPPAELARFAGAVRDHRLLAVTGAMGTGKTTLATALCRPELLPHEGTHGVPHVAAVVRLSDTHWASGTSVKQLAEQLQMHLSGFAEARRAYRTQVPQAERALLPAPVAEIGGPLTLMERREPVRVIVDGLDQVNPANRRGLVEGLVALRDTAPGWFGVVATVRDGIPLDGDWHREPVPAPSERQLQDYLRSRHVSKAGHGPIIGRTGGNWQLTKVLAGHRGATARTGRISFTQVYLEVLGPLRQLVPGGQGAWLDAVLVVVAASGPGVTLPRALLARAVGALGGPDDEMLEQVLELLPGLVVRSAHPAGTELFGVHHPSLIEYVADDQDVMGGHRALCEALAIMAPMEQHTSDDPLHAYAEEAEPEHLWQAAQRDDSLYDLLLESLERRAAPEATVNRDRWAAWADRLAQRPGRDSAPALHACERTAYWTGKAGAYERSRELYRNLLADQRRVFGDHDPRLLGARDRIAYATGEVGDFAEAVELHRAVLADQERVLGADDPRTLKTRHHIAYWTGRGGNMAEVLRLHEELLEDQLRVLGPTDQAVLESRHYIAYWHGMLGRCDTALALHDELLRDRIAVFGEDHPQVVFSRMNICKFLGESGRRQEALDGYRTLLPWRAAPQHPVGAVEHRPLHRGAGRPGGRSGAAGAAHRGPAGGAWGRPPDRHDHPLQHRHAQGRTGPSGYRSRRAGGVAAGPDRPLRQSISPGGDQDPVRDRAGHRDDRGRGGGRGPVARGQGRPCPGSRRGAPRHAGHAGGTGGAARGLTGRADGPRVPPGAQPACSPRTSGSTTASDPRSPVTGVPSTRIVEACQAWKPVQVAASWPVVGERPVSEPSGRHLKPRGTMLSPQTRPFRSSSTRRTTTLDSSPIKLESSVQRLRRSRSTSSRITRPALFVDGRTPAVPLVAEGMNHGHIHGRSDNPSR